MSANPPMDPDIPNRFEAKPSNARHLFLYFLLLAILASFLAWQASQRGNAELVNGRVAPEIHALGWVNGDVPTSETLKNRVIFVEAWATWCGPCRQITPHIVELHRKFAERGVIFISLTAEDESSLPQIKAFLETSGVTWLNGWGAEPTLRELEADYIPRSYIIGANGRIVWDSSAGGNVEKILELALKQAATSRPRS